MSDDSYTGRGYDPSLSFWGRLGDRFGLVTMRPKLMDDVRIRRIGEDAELVQVSTGQVIALADSDIRIARRFDGSQTIAEIIAGEIEAEGKIDIEPVLLLVDRVMRAKMLENFPPNLFNQLDTHMARHAVAIAQQSAADEEDEDGDSGASSIARPETGEVLSAYEQVPWRPKTPLLAERAKFFRNVELLRNMDLHSIGLLAENAREEAFPAAHNIITEGEMADRFYIIRSGDINVTRRDEDGIPRRIAKLTTGDWFGEAGILDHKARNATVRAGPSRPVQAYSFDSAMFEKIISPGIEAFRGRQQLARRRERLAEMTLFESLSDDDLERLAQSVREVRAPKKSAVFRQGEDGDRFYVIVEGSVGVVRDGVPVARLSAGDFFGETALLFSTTRTATVVTTEDCLFWTIDRPAFERIVREHLLGRRDMMPTVLNRLHA